MKLLILVLFSFNLIAAELKEDPSNVDCVKSIHGSRPYLATVKQETSDQEEPVIKTKEIRTIEK